MTENSTAPSYPGNAPRGDIDTLRRVNPEAFIGAAVRESLTEQRSGAEEPPVKHNKFQEQVAQEFAKDTNHRFTLANSVLHKVIECLQDDDIQNILRGKTSRASKHERKGGEVVSHPAHLLVPQANAGRNDDSAQAILKKHFGRDKHHHVWEIREILIAIRREIEMANLADTDKFGLLHEYCAVALLNLPNREQAKNLTIMATPPDHTPGQRF